MGLHDLPKNLLPSVWKDNPHGISTGLRQIYVQKTLSVSQAIQADAAAFVDQRDARLRDRFALGIKQRDLKAGLSLDLYIIRSI